MKNIAFSRQKRRNNRRPLWPDPRELLLFAPGAKKLDPHAFVVMDDPDPVETLRQSWNAHVAFGLAEPGLFALMSANPHSPAAAKGMEAFRHLIRMVARAGRLGTSEERALAVVRAGCVGVVTTLVADGTTDADAVSATTREAVIRAVTGDAGPSSASGVRTHAATLRAGLDDASGFTKGELALFD